MVFNIGLKLFTKKIHTSPYMRIESIESARIILNDADSLHTDGEHKSLDKQTLSIKVVPACLKVIVPKTKQ